MKKYPCDTVVSKCFDFLFAEFLISSFYIIFLGFLWFTEDIISIEEESLRIRIFSVQPAVLHLYKLLAKSINWMTCIRGDKNLCNGA